MKQTGGRKSRDTLPLRGMFLLREMYAKYTSTVTTCKQVLAPNIVYGPAKPNQTPPNPTPPVFLFGESPIMLQEPEVSKDQVRALAEKTPQCFPLFFCAVVHVQLR